MSLPLNQLRRKKIVVKVGTASISLSPLLRLRPVVVDQAVLTPENQTVGYLRCKISVASNADDDTAQLLETGSDDQVLEVWHGWRNDVDHIGVTVLIERITENSGSLPPQLSFVFMLGDETCKSEPLAKKAAVNHQHLSDLVVTDELISMFKYGTLPVEVIGYKPQLAQSLLRTLNRDAASAAQSPAATPTTAMPAALAVSTPIPISALNVHHSSAEKPSHPQPQQPAQQSTTPPSSPSRAQSNTSTPSTISFPQQKSTPPSPVVAVARRISGRDSTAVVPTVPPLMAVAAPELQRKLSDLQHHNSALEEQTALLTERNRLLESELEMLKRERVAMNDKSGSGCGGGSRACSVM
eukprot:TRINITY_DN6305_c1_g1_i1.p1 TRINITY_DN6305_c1_g1~~TRINITY_DN6305_c1_g1_i1.p1  ORF type:complete len:354 (+),score=58.66 TRINITY_DN6305_c1_g1_i1:301-1362(+)